jgi:hypothetical protein
MHVEDFNVRVVGKVLTEFRDVNIQTSALEQVLVAPDVLQGRISFDKKAVAFQEVQQEFGLNGGEFNFFANKRQGARLRVKMVLANVKSVGRRRLECLLSFHPAHDVLDAQVKFLKAKWFGNVIVGAQGKPLDTLFFLSGAGEKNDRDQGRYGPDFGGQGKAVFQGHFNIQHTDVERVFFKSGKRIEPIVEQGYGAAFGLQIFEGKLAEMDFVVNKQYMHHYGS